MKKTILFSSLLIACSSPTAPIPPPTPTTTLPSPAPTPAPTPDPYEGCPPLDHIRAYILLNLGPKDQVLKRNEPGRPGGRIVIDTTPFFRFPDGSVKSCNADHPNCGKPATKCEDSRGQTWTATISQVSRQVGAWHWQINCEAGEAGYPDSCFSAVILFSDFEGNPGDPGTETFTACPRPDAPAHYKDGWCGNVTVVVQ